MIQEFVPSAHYIVRPHTGGIKRLLNDTNKVSFIKRNLNTKTNSQLARILNCQLCTIRVAIQRLGLKRRNNIRVKLTGKHGLMMEDYFANELTTNQICEKYNCSHNTVLKYVKMMIPIKPSEDTETITRQSKM